MMQHPYGPGTVPGTHYHRAHFPDPGPPSWPMRISAMAALAGFPVGLLLWLQIRGPVNGIILLVQLPGLLLVYCGVVYVCIRMLERSTARPCRFRWSSAPARGVTAAGLWLFVGGVVIIGMFLGGTRDRAPLVVRWFGFSRSVDWLPVFAAGEITALLGAILVMVGFGAAVLSGRRRLDSLLAPVPGVNGAPAV